MQVSESDIETYQRDGVLQIKGALSPSWVELIANGIERNIRNPGPFASTYFKGHPGEFNDDYCNYETIPEFRMLLQMSPIADMAMALTRSSNLWLFYDQIFVKEGGFSRRTPWHQDTPYFVGEGTQFISAWITIDHLSADESLECVRGTHAGPMYNGNAFDPNDEAKPYYEDTNLPPPPWIEAERDKWDIVSWPTEPGDILFHHPGIFHGGAAMREGGRRRTLALRMFGDDVRYRAVPGKPAPPFPGLEQSLKVGDPLRHPYFPLLRSAAVSGAA